MITRKRKAWDLHTLAVGETRRYPTRKFGPAMGIRQYVMETNYRTGMKLSCRTERPTAPQPGVKKSGAVLVTRLA